MVALTALDQAAYIVEHIETMTNADRFDACVSLLEWEVFSNRQIAEITGVSRERVNSLSGKTDKRGGTLDVLYLPDIRDLRNKALRGEDVKADVRFVLSGRTSSTMLSRLSGLSQSTISRWARSAG